MVFPLSAVPVLVGDGVTRSSVLTVAAVLLVLYLIYKASFGKKRRLPPAIPGLPVVGNMLQLLDRRPFRTFGAWADKYGPIFSIRIGSQKLVVINSGEIAKEAMVDKFSSISSRKLTTAFSILTRKIVMAAADYGDEYRLLKKLAVSHLLGPVPQRERRSLRETISYNMLDGIYTALNENSGCQLNIRDHMTRALYLFSLIQVIGRDPGESFYVEELRRNVSRLESFSILITNPMKTFLRVDWRNLFPAFKWVPNKTMEREVHEVEFQRTAVVRAFLREQKKLLANGKEPNCLLDTLLTEGKLNPNQLELLTWELIIESADTTIVTLEWILYELAKMPSMQERIYKEIKEVAGDGIILEDHLPSLPLVAAVVNETLRKRPAVALILPRFVDTDVQIGGYDIPRGWEIFINIYGINHDKSVWPDPDAWDPDRMLCNTNLDFGYKDFRALPFGTGKRMCAGITQAMYVIPANVAYFVQHFTWTLTPEDSSTHSTGENDTLSFTTHKLHPLQLVLTPRVPKRLNA